MKFNQSDLTQNIVIPVIFIFLYIEPIAIAGLKFSHLYKLVIIYILTLSILLHRSYRIYDRNENQYQLLLFILYCWAIQPILFAPAREHITNSVFIGGQRLFSVLLFHWSLHKNFSAETLFRFYNYFIIYNMLTALPFIAGLIRPLGSVYDISKFGIEAANAFIGVFQTSHNAALIMTMSGVGAFSLMYTNTNKKSRIYYILLTIGFILLTIFTYARAGWIAFIAGLFAVLWEVNKTKSIFREKKTWLFIGCITIVLFGLTIKYGEALKMRALGQTKYNIRTATGFDAISSGRLSIWNASKEIFLDASMLEKIAGIGEEELTRRMHRQIGLKLFAHNGFINQLLSNGLIGLSLLLSLIISLWYQISGVKHKRYRILCIASFVCWLTHFIFQGGEFPIALSLLFLVVTISIKSQNSISEKRMMAI